MVSSSTEICNLALSHIGVGKEISNIDTDRSSEGLACKRFYTAVLEEVLRDFSWPFCTKIDTLALITTLPNNEWGYSYRVPSDCLRIKRILSGLRNDSNDTRVPYKLSQDSTGLILFCDITSAQIEYTVRTTDVNKFPPDFVMAFSLKLGAFIAPRVTGGDPFKLRSSTLQLYQEYISKARANAANEEQPDVLPDGEFIRGRD